MIHVVHFLVQAFKEQQLKPLSLVMLSQSLVSDLMMELLQLLAIITTLMQIVTLTLGEMQIFTLVLSAQNAKQHSLL